MGVVWMGEVFDVNRDIRENLSPRRDAGHTVLNPSLPDVNFFRKPSGSPNLNSISINLKLWLAHLVAVLSPFELRTQIVSR
jgi:hypothetical protein